MGTVSVREVLEMRVRESTKQFSDQRTHKQMGGAPNA
jgi:hypothetical protein